MPSFRKRLCSHRDLFLSYIALKRALESSLAPDIMKMRSSGFHVSHQFKAFADESTTIEEQNCLRGCHNYINALQGVLQGWRFIVTKSGYVGVASNQPIKGDKVVLFSGGAVPFVLRKGSRKSGGHDLYRLVGECYIHGIMGGEAWHSGGKASAIRLYWSNSMSGDS